MYISALEAKQKAHSKYVYNSFPFLWHAYMHLPTSLNVEQWESN